MTAVPREGLGAGLATNLPDAHLHLAYVARDAGRQALDAFLASRPREREAARLLVDPGVDPGDLAARRELSGTYPFVRFLAGLWPAEEACERPDAALEAFRRDLDSGFCAGVGECGLDYHWMHSTKERQRALFEAQLAEARDRSMPVFVHSRDAAEDTVEIARSALEGYRSAGAARGGAGKGFAVIIHCYSYGPREAERLLEAGCHLSFSGSLTYPSARAIREACLLVPRDRLLVETDAPYLAPVPRRGSHCRPEWIAHTYAAIAELKGCPVEELARSTEENLEALLG